MSTTLRPYQLEALEAIKAAYARGITRQLLVLPTGTGKTVVFASLPRYFPQLGRMLVLAHTELLVKQAINSIRKWNPSLKVGKEMAQDKCERSDHVVVGSVPTLGRAGSSRIYKFDRTLFNIIVIDEAHHSLASTYKRICDRFELLAGTNKRLLLGVTATPNRSDNQGLCEIFQEIVYSMNIRQAVEQGWLCDLKGYRVTSSVALDYVDVKEGDFVPSSLARTVNNSARNELIVKNWLAFGKNRQTIVFCATIQHARELAAAFQANSVPAGAIWGEDPDKEDKIAEHKAKKLTVLTNCMVLKEGYDDWRVSCIVMARPTLSQLLFVQMIGRGTRIPSSINNLNEARLAGLRIEKEDCIVVDVVDNTSRHQVVTLPSLVGMGVDTDLQGRSIVQPFGQKHWLEPPRSSTIEGAKSLMTEVAEVDLLSQMRTRHSRFEWKEVGGTFETANGWFTLMREGEAWTARLRLRQTVYPFATCKSFTAAIATAENAIHNPGFRNFFHFVECRQRNPGTKACRAELRLLKLFQKHVSRGISHHDATTLLVRLVADDLIRNGGRKTLHSMKCFLSQHRLPGSTGILRLG